MILQKHNHDCLQCCLSELLDIPYEEIPEFYKLYIDERKQFEEVKDWKEDIFEIKYDEWLKSNGYTRFVFDAEFKDGALLTPYFSQSFKCIGVMKKSGRSYSHAVITHFLEDGTILWEDPKVDSDYEFSDLIKIEIIVSGIIPAGEKNGKSRKC